MSSKKFQRKTFPLSIEKAERILQSAVSDFADRLNDRPEIAQQCLKALPQFKEEFGKGFILLDIGRYNCNQNCFHPRRKHQGTSLFQMAYLNRDSFQKYLHNVHDFDQLWTQLEPDYESCPDDHVLVVVMADLDRGQGADPRFFLYFEPRLMFTKKFEPLPLTNQQIHRALAIYPLAFLVLDTSQPPYMGENLEKWVRAVRARQALGQHCPKVMIHSCPEYPAVLPPDLQDGTIALPFL